MKNVRPFLFGAATAALCAAALAYVVLPHGSAFAQMMGHSGKHGGQHGSDRYAEGQHMHGHGHGHGAQGMDHDMVNMPGLRGVDTSETETAEMALMFRRFETISRSVTRLPDGIRTVTGSTDPEVMGAIASHVSGMIARVEEGRDPGVFIQSPTLGIFFERGADIDTQIEVTDAGIVVEQRTQDPELVAALYRHADEVTDMAERGMQAVHERMMQGGGH